jgi:hypothetical protein
LKRSRRYWTALRSPIRCASVAAGQSLPDAGNCDLNLGPKRAARVRQELC